MGLINEHFKVLCFIQTNLLNLKWAPNIPNDFTFERKKNMKWIGVSLEFPVAVQDISKKT